MNNSKNPTISSNIPRPPSSSRGQWPYKLRTRAGSAKLESLLRLGIWTLALCLGTFAKAQNYTIDWYKIAGGSGTSTGGVYSVSGTIGQPDASANQGMAGGNYSLTGGFWALISVLQTPGLPNLLITRSGNRVLISWPDPATNSYTLQQNSSLANTGGWAAASYLLSSAGGTNSITITAPTGNLFFRLKQ